MKVAALVLGFFSSFGSLVLAAEGEYRSDFSKESPQQSPDGWFALSGEFLVIAENEEQFVRLSPDPIEEHGAILGPSSKGAGTITARIRGEKKKRSAPRFGVGLHGSLGPRLRVVPVLKKLELLKGDETLATADFDWQGDWTWLKLDLAEINGAWSLRGWAWTGAKEDEPEEPAVRAVLDSAPGTGKCSVWGTPYSATPIDFDDISIKVDPKVEN